MVDRLGWTLVHFVWEGAAVAALLALALGMARRASASLRYGVALAALALMAALPLATFVALAPPATSSSIASGAILVSPGEVVNAGGPETGGLPLVVGLWAIGVVVLSLRLAGTLLHLERWRRLHTRPAPPEQQARLDALAKGLGMRRRVALCLSDRIEVPSAWGLFRPLVVLPMSLLTGLPPDGVEGILLHELAHVRRHDYLVNLLQSVVETALFYHPAVWWVSSAVRREREHLCDDVVVAALGDPMPYARALLYLEERRQTPRPALSAKEGKLMNRIARILAPRPAPARLSPLAPTLAALTVVALALGGVLNAGAQAPKAPTSKSTSNSPKSSAKNAPAVAERNRVLEMRLQEIQARRADASMQEQRRLRAELQLLKAQLEAARREGERSRTSLPAISIAKGRELAAMDAVRAAQVRAETTVRIAQAQLAKPAPPNSVVARVYGQPAVGFAPPAPQVEATGAGEVSIDADGSVFTATIRALAKKAKMSVVIEGGPYSLVTAMFQTLSREDALRVLCKAGGATFRFEDGIYYVSPQGPASAGGLGGGGFGGG